MIIDPREQDYRNVYKLMIGVIVPRPIAFVSTVNLDGIRNLAPFSFFTGATGPERIRSATLRRPGNLW